MHMAQLEHRHINKKNEARKQSNKVQVSKLEDQPQALVERAIQRNARSAAEADMFRSMVGLLTDDLAEAS